MYKRIFELNYDGKVPSKKNMYKMRVTPGKFGKMIPRMYKSQECIEFQEDMDSQFISQMDYPEKPLQKVHIDFEFRYSTNRRTDSDNKVTAILDVLQEISILEDDRWQLIPKFSVSSKKAIRDGFKITIMELEDE